MNELSALQLNPELAAHVRAAYLRQPESRRSELAAELASALQTEFDDGDTLGCVVMHASPDGQDVWITAHPLDWDGYRHPGLAGLILWTAPAQYGAPEEGGLDLAD